MSSAKVQSGVVHHSACPWTLSSELLLPQSGGLTLPGDNDEGSTVSQLAEEFWTEYVRQDAARGSVQPSPGKVTTGTIATATEHRSCACSHVNIFPFPRFLSECRCCSPLDQAVYQYRYRIAQGSSPLWNDYVDVWICKCIALICSRTVCNCCQDGRIPHSATPAGDGVINICSIEGNVSDDHLGMRESQPLKFLFQLLKFQPFFQPFEISFFFRRQESI